MESILNPELASILLFYPINFLKKDFDASEGEKGGKANGYLDSF